MVPRDSAHPASAFEKMASRLAATPPDQLPPGAEFQKVLLDGLVVRLRSRFRADPELVHDASTAALSRFGEAVREGRVDPATADAYLAAIAVNAMIDALRRQRRLPKPVPPEDLEGSEPDSAAAALLEASAADGAAEAVRAGMHAAFRAGRVDLIEVVRSWLDLAEKLERPPTLREVAAETRRSHMKVHRALAEFRVFVPDGTRRA